MPLKKTCNAKKNRHEKIIVSDTPTAVLASIKHMIEQFETEQKTLENARTRHSYTKTGTDLFLVSLNTNYPINHK